MNGGRLGPLLVACVLGACAEPVGQNPSLAFQAWINGELFALTPADVSIDFDSAFVVSAIQTNPDGSSREVNLRIVEWHGTGGYPVGGSDAPATAFVRDRAPNGDIVTIWETTDAVIGQIVVTADDGSGVGGTFRFEARAPGGSTLEVAGGAFFGEYDP